MPSHSSLVQVNRILITSQRHTCADKAKYTKRLLGEYRGVRAPSLTLSSPQIDREEGGRAVIKAQTAVKGEWEGGRKEGREEERFLERRAHRMYSRSRGKGGLAGDLFGTTR